MSCGGCRSGVPVGGFVPRWTRADHGRDERGHQDDGGGRRGHRDDTGKWSAELEDLIGRWNYQYNGARIRGRADPIGTACDVLRRNARADPFASAFIRADGDSFRRCDVTIIFNYICHRRILSFGVSRFCGLLTC